MNTVRIGDKGPDVQFAQEKLNEHGYDLVPDGDFGPKTEEATMSFQRSVDIYDDGIIGRLTWVKLIDQVWEDVDCLLHWKKVPADPYGEGYDRHNLRQDIAVAYTRVYNSLKEKGGLLTSSGSKRNLTANVSSNRSSTSLHYIGRALDLFVYSGMHDLDKDPYVVVRDGDRYWTVWARVTSGGKNLTLKGWHHPSQSEVDVTGQFINLTDLFKAYGFERIKSRSSYGSGNYGASEWWHFQNVLGLIPNETKWGDELLRIYKLKVLEKSSPWKLRDGLWHKDWF